MQIIVLATDFTKEAEAAYPYAAALTASLEHSDYQLILFHAVENVFESTFGFDLGEDVDEVLNGVEQQALAELESLSQREFRDLIPQTAVIRAQEKVHDEILNFAARRKADLIIMGVRGLGGLQQALLGSVAAKVVRGAHCPVMVVPYIEAED
jgi:nucleotide-binding universal stress UspA family protein